MGKWKFEIIEDWGSAFSESHIERWNQLMENSENAHVFFHPAMLKAWVETYLPLRDIKPIFVWGNDGKRTLFFPLVMWKRNWKNAFLKTIVPAGFSDFDYHDPIVSEELSDEEYGEFWTELESVLKDYRYDRIELDGLHAHPTDWRVKKEENCPYITLNEFADVEEFRKTLNTSFRKNIDRRMRRLEEQGRVSILVHQTAESALADNALPLMLKMHSERWPHAYKAPNFHKNLIEEGIPAGIVYYSQLMLDERPVSWKICFKYKKTFHTYMPAIDKEFSTYSVGNLHIMKCIEECFAMGMERYDFLRGEEKYKNEWTPTSNMVRNVERDGDSVVAKVKCKIKDLR